jgi:hypothetical protein
MNCARQNDSGIYGKSKLGYANERHINKDLQEHNQNLVNPLM